MTGKQIDMFEDPGEAIDNMHEANWAAATAGELDPVAELRKEVEFNRGRAESLSANLTAKIDECARIRKEAAAREDELLCAMMDAYNGIVKAHNSLPAGRYTGEVLVHHIANVMFSAIEDAHAIFEKVKERK